MADSNALGEILGAILAAVAHARRVADEETVSIADYYRRNPLLAGMSVPRVRVPQLDVEIPVVIEEFVDSQDGRLASPDSILENVVRTLADAAERERDRDSQALAREFEQVFTGRLEISLARQKPSAQVVVAEVTARCAEEALVEVLKRDSQPRFDQQQLRRVSDAVKMAAAESTVVEPSTPPEFRVTVLTSHVKDKADPATVARIRMTVREDGVEWTSVERPDGTTRDQLIPE